jgi:hypothetical protein
MNYSSLTYAAILVLFISVNQTQAQEVVTSPNAGVFDSIASHPRLVLTDDRIDELRNQIEADPFSRRFFEHLVSWADSLIEVPPLKRELTGRRMLRISGNLLEQVTVLGVTGKILDEDIYIKSAIQQLKTVAAFEDWNPDHFLDTAEMTAGVALGYDWFFDYLSDDEKQLLVSAIVDKGLKPSLVYDEWATRTNNWNSVGHGGITLGALAVAEQVPELARQILDRAQENVHRVASSYAPDGAYKEGPMYWAYGTFYVSLYMSALESALGITYDIDKIPGFMESADYMIQVAGPGSQYFNYGDNYIERVFTTATFWFEKQTGRRDLADYHRMLVLNHNESSQSSKPGYLQGGSRFAPFALIWHHPGNEQTIEKPLFWIADGEMPVAIMRTSWDDPNAAFLGIKGGSVNVSHAHMDVGSFVIEADGVRWAIDLGHQDYHTLEAAGLHIWNYRGDSDRWKVFRLGPESHNFLRFNNNIQNPAGFARLDTDAKPGTIGSVKVDLTDINFPYIKSHTRDAWLNNDHTIVIRDNWESAGLEPVNITWQMLTDSEIMITSDGFYLQKDDKAMNVIAETNHGTARFEVQDVNDLLSGFDMTNPGVSRLLIHLEKEEHTAGEITVTFVPANTRKN